MSLPCGGRGPCCHIGYSHRHCAHCDFVIPLHHYFQPCQPYWGSTFGGFNQAFNANTSGLVPRVLDAAHNEDHHPS